MALQESWSIRSRARQCAATEEPFVEDEVIVTALFPDPESSGYLRKDFKLDAWEARDSDEETAFSFWRSRYQPPVTDATPDPMEKEDPETLLRRLVDEDEEHTENVRYILAVMLERKKLLRETDCQQVPGGILRVYEHRKTGDAYLVRDPNIPLDQVEKVQEEVIILLEHGGRLPEPEPETPEEGESEDSSSSESNLDEVTAGQDDGGRSGDEAEEESEPDGNADEDNDDLGAEESEIETGGEDEEKPV